MYMTCYGTGVLRLMSHRKARGRDKDLDGSLSQSSLTAQDGLVVIMNGSYGIESASFTRLC